jgi:hypothetical protein
MPKRVFASVNSGRSVFISASLLLLVLVLAGGVASTTGVGVAIAAVGVGKAGAAGATGAAAQPASALTVAANRARAVLLGVLVMAGLYQALALVCEHDFS